MNIFSEVKEHLTARQAAEYYGLKIRRNGNACCPFHDDKHPSMKIDKNYHCFACGVGGDAVDYVSRMFGLSQYDAALKLIEDFTFPFCVLASDSSTPSTVLISTSSASPTAFHNLFSACADCSCNFLHLLSVLQKQLLPL